MIDAQYNLLLKLHTWALGQDENFVTEAFAHLVRYLLRHEPRAGLELLRRLSGGRFDAADDLASRVVVQTQVTVETLRPDMVVTAPGWLIYVEVKVEAGLGESQLRLYRERLNRSGVDNTCLVLLTQYHTTPPEDEEPDTAHRWYEVADWLEEVQGSAMEPSSIFLVNQFLGFLRGRGMTIEHVNSELKRGVESLVSLTTMLQKALEGQSIPFKTNSTPEWFGFNVERMRYFVGLYLNQPTLLRFRTYSYEIDAEKCAELKVGRTWTQAGRLRWENLLDLESEEVQFYSLTKAGQMARVEQFVSQSFDLAERIAETKS